MDATDDTRFGQLLAAVQAVDVDELDDVALRDVLVESDRLRNAAEALQARVMVEMRDRAHRDDAADRTALDPVVPTGAREEFVVDEIAAHLRCTRMAASHRFSVALAAEQHRPLGLAWAAGRVDGRKVQVIGDLLLDTDPVIADTLATAAVAYASTHSGPQLRTWLARRVLAADPAAAEQRRQRATAGRQVALTPLADGVAELAARMPAVQARGIYDTLTALAHATDGADVRTLDQRRSDALFDLVTGRAAPPTVTLNVTVPADLLTEGSSCGCSSSGTAASGTTAAVDHASATSAPGTAASGTAASGTAASGTSASAEDAAQDPPVGDPASADTVSPLTRPMLIELAGFGPLTAGALRELAGVGAMRWRRLLTDPVSGVLTDLSESRYRPSSRLDSAVRARDLTCRFPGCRRPATTSRSGVDLDHVTPWPHGPTSATNLVCLCRHHHRLKHSPGWRVDLQADGTLHWTTPTGHRFTTEPWRYTDASDGPGDASTRLDDAA